MRKNLKSDTKYSLNVAKKLIPKGGKAQQKRVALALRLLQINQLKDLKLEIKLLKESIKKLQQEILALKRYPYDE